MKVTSEQGSALTISDGEMTYTCPDTVETPVDAILWLLEGYDYRDMKRGERFTITVRRGSEIILSCPYIKGY